MSVTFFMPQAPVTRVQPHPEDEPEWIDIVPVAPFTELNVSNANAAAILGIVAPWADPYCGEWKGDMLHTVRKNIMRVLNRNPERLESPIEIGRNYVDMGRSAEYVHARLTALLAVITVAVSNEFSVCYG